MTKPKLSIQTRKAHTADGFAGHASTLDQMQNTQPIYLDWSGGKIKKMYCTHGEIVTLKNIKRGIAALFQFQSTDMTVNEQDTSGNCLVSYKLVNKNTMVKRKSRCQRQGPNQSFARIEKVKWIKINHLNKFE